MKCSPHNWRQPLPGDVALHCLDCGRELDLMDEVTPNIRAAIVNSIAARRPGEVNAFKGFFGFGPLADEYGNKPKPQISPVDRPLTIRQRKRRP